MATITKYADRGVAPNLRVQTWDSRTDLDDAGGAIAGSDIFRISESLGHPAHQLTIEMFVSSGSFRINPRVTLYPRRPPGEGSNYLSNWYPNVAAGVSYLSTRQDPVVVPAGGTYVLDNEVPVEEVEIVSIGTGGYVRLTAI